MAKMSRAEIQKQMDANRGRVINNKKTQEIKEAATKAMNKVPKPKRIV